jgi:hypothetical protein
MKKAVNDLTFFQIEDREKIKARCTQLMNMKQGYK